MLQASIVWPQKLSSVVNSQSIDEWLFRNNKYCNQFVALYQTKQTYQILGIKNL